MDQQNRNSETALCVGGPLPGQTNQSPSSPHALPVDERVREVVRVMQAAIDMDYIGEPISQLEHGLQCAKFAFDAGADDETVLAALFHDIGHFVVFCEDGKKRLALEKPVDKMGDMGVAKHEVLGGRYLKALGFSDKTAALVEGHVLAKRYLVWKNQHYSQKLSPASKITLQYQGGPMTTEEAQLFEKSELFDTILKMRTWDDKAKIVGAKVPNLDHWVPLMFSQLNRQRELHQQELI
jgi:predicted HD phosphohydrolase